MRRLLAMVLSAAAVALVLSCLSGDAFTAKSTNFPAPVGIGLTANTSPSAGAALQVGNGAQSMRYYPTGAANTGQIALGNAVFTPAGHDFAISKNVNDAIGNDIENTSAGTLAYSEFEAQNNLGHNIVIRSYSSGWIPQHDAQFADSGHLCSNHGAGGLSISSDADVRFYAGSQDNANLVATMASADLSIKLAGHMALGSGGAIHPGYLVNAIDSNATGNGLTVKNTSTAGYSEASSNNNLSHLAYVRSFGSTYSDGTAAQCADCVTIGGTTTNGVNFVANNGPAYFYTRGVAAGNLTSKMDSAPASDGLVGLWVMAHTSGAPALRQVKADTAAGGKRMLYIDP